MHVLNEIRENKTSKTKVLRSNPDRDKNVGGDGWKKIVVEIVGIHPRTNCSG